jgi:tetratricopeptide (TPR) repeat protein
MSWRWGAPLALLLIAGCPPAKPVEHPKPLATVKDSDLPEDPAELIKFADAEYKKATPEAMENALKALSKALAKEKTSYEALWRTARVYAWLGDEYTDDARVAESSQKGIDVAKLAIAADEKRVEGQYYLATCTGQFAFVKKLKAKDLVPLILDAAKKAVSADEKFDHAGPLRLLGSVYAQAPEPPTSVGDHEEGVKLLSRAVQLSNVYPQNHLLLGDALRINDNLDQAEREYQVVLATPPSGKWGAREAKWKQAAEDGLKRVNNKRRQKNAGDRGAGF